MGGGGAGGGGGEAGRSFAIGGAARGRVLRYRGTVLTQQKLHKTTQKSEARRPFII